MSNFKLEEEDIDPLSLTNLILRRDYRIGGSGLGWCKNWITDSARSITPNEIMADAATSFGTTDDIILEAVQKKKTKAKAKKPVAQPQETQDPAMQGAQAPPEQGQEQQQGLPSPEIPEQNTVDPNMFSTDFDANPCCAFMQGICRVDGRPCLFTIQDYIECGKHNLAKSADPELMEIPPGVEHSFSYIKGQHA